MSPPTSQHLSVNHFVYTVHMPLYQVAALVTGTHNLLVVEALIKSVERVNIANELDRTKAL